RNVISGNSNYGVEISGGTNNLVAGNYIGTNLAGVVTPGLGTTVGVLINEGASNNTIRNNVIAGNAGAGVSISGSRTTNNAILGNSIHDNNGLGIDLGGDGVTPND